MPEYQKNSLAWLDVSSVTANKLLKGEFKTYQELDASSSADSDGVDNIKIVLQKIQNKKEKPIYLIETIFINE